MHKRIYIYDDAGVREVPRPHGVVGNIRTLQMARDLVLTALSRDLKDPNQSLRNIALRLTTDISSYDAMREVERIYVYVRDRITYKRDPISEEKVQSPMVTLRRGVGDCVDKSVLLATLLATIGYRSRFVVIGVRSVAQFEHVYVETLINGRWVALDPSTPRPLHINEAPSARIRKHFSIWEPDPNDPDELGFLSTLVQVGSQVGTALVGGLFGSRSQKKSQEAARDAQREAAYAAISDIIQQIRAGRIDPDAGVAQARQIAEQYYAWAAQNLSGSVLASAQNFRTQPGGFNDHIKWAEQAAAEAKARSAAAAPAAAATPSWLIPAMIGGGLLLVMR